MEKASEIVLIGAGGAVVGVLAQQIGSTAKSSTVQSLSKGVGGAIVGGIAAYVGHKLDHKGGDGLMGAGIGFAASAIL